MRKAFLAIILLLFASVSWADTPDTLPRWATGGSLVDSIIKESQDISRNLGIGTSGVFPVIGGMTGFRSVTIEGSNYGGAVLELINKGGHAASEPGKIEILNLDASGNIIGRALINGIADADATRLGIGTAIQNPGEADAYYTTFVRYNGDYGIGTTFPNVNGQARAITLAAKGTTPIPRVGTGAFEVIGNRQGVDGAVALFDFQNENAVLGQPQRIAALLALTKGCDTCGEISIYTKNVGTGLVKQFTISPDGRVTFWHLQGGGTTYGCIDPDGTLVRC